MKDKLSRPTIRDYVALLERIFLLDILPPWHSTRLSRTRLSRTRLSRLIKTPKARVDNTRVACSLRGLDAHGLTHDREILGYLVKTFLFQELHRQPSWHGTEIRFYHFCDKDG